MTSPEVVTPTDLVVLARKATATYLRSRPSLRPEREDMMGDASLAAHIAHQRYDGTGTFKGYAYPLVTFAIIDGLRLRGRLTRKDYADARNGVGMTAARLAPLHLSHDDLTSTDVADLQGETPHRHLEGQLAALSALRLLDEWPREQEVIRRVVLEGEPQMCVAKDFGVSESRICQLRSVALWRLRHHPDMPDTLTG